VQAASGWSCVPEQVFAEMAKLLGLAPLKVKPLKMSGPLPVLVIVTTQAAEADPTSVVGKAQDVGPIVRVGVAAVPVTVMDCGELAALSVMETVELKVPAARGLKVTLMVQLVLTATVTGRVPHAEVTAKSAVLPPAMDRAVTISGVPVPVFWIVALMAAEVVLISVKGKLRDVGVREAVGGVTVPESATDCGLPAALSAIKMLAVMVTGVAVRGAKVT